MTFIKSEGLRKWSLAAIGIAVITIMAVVDVAVDGVEIPIDIYYTIGGICGIQNITQGIVDAIKPKTAPALETPQ